MAVRTYWLAAGAVMLLAGGWFWGRPLAATAPTPAAASRADLEELRAQLERQQQELRGTQRLAMRMRDALSEQPAPKAEASDERAAPAARAQAAVTSEPSKEDEDRFFNDYFSDLSDEMRSQGHDQARTAEVRSAAATVIAENQLGELDEVDCSSALCRVSLNNVPEEARARFAAVFSTRMGRQFGSGSIHSPIGNERIVGFFAPPEERLPPPLTPLVATGAPTHASNE
jgi:hypothetical protein